MAARKAQGGTRPAATADRRAGVGRYPVLSPLRIGGRLYGPDDPDANVVTMTEDQAGPLQSLTVLGDRLD